LKVVLKIVLGGPRTPIARITHSVLDQPTLPPRPSFWSGEILYIY